MVKKIKAEGPLSEYKEEKLKKKSNIPNVKVGLDAIRDAVLSCKDDMIEITKNRNLSDKPKYSAMIKDIIFQIPNHIGAIRV